MASVYYDWPTTATTTYAPENTSDTTSDFVIAGFADVNDAAFADVNDAACKEEPEEEREHYFGPVRLPPARRILRKRRPAQRQSEYG